MNTPTAEAFAALQSQLATRDAELAEAHAFQAATAEVLRVISGSIADSLPVFDKIVESCDRLLATNHVAVCLLQDDGLLRLTAHRSEILDRNPDLPKIFAADDPVVGAALRECRAVHYANTHQAGLQLSSVSASWAEALGEHSLLMAPLVLDGRGIGLMVLARFPPRPFSEREINLLVAFCDQAVIAVENIRLFNETKEALEQQKASAEILRVISSSVADTQPVFEKILESCLRLFSVKDVGIFLVDENDRLSLTAGRGPFMPLVADVFPMPIGGTVQQEAIQARHPIHYSSVAFGRVLPVDIQLVRDHLGDHSAIVAPMIWEDRGVGNIVIAAVPARSFSEKEIALLGTFAGQAVIAIQNARLFNETKEALEQQTAMAEILKVISESPTDLQPVFDAITKRAMALCGARIGGVTRFDGELVHLVALHGLSSDATDAVRNVFPMKPGRGGTNARAIFARAPVQSANVFSDPTYTVTEAARAAGTPSQLAVPMLREGRVVGSIWVARGEVGPFPDTLVKLLQTFADQAVIAIENVRLFNETKEALERQTATAEILKVISESPTDVQPVFDAIAERAAILCGAPLGTVTRFDSELVHLVAHYGDSPDAKEVKAIRAYFPMEPNRIFPIMRAILDRKPVLVADFASDPEMAELGDLVRSASYRSGLAVPLLREGQAIGSIMVTRREPGTFPDKLVTLLQTFADQAVIAIENARLFHEIEYKSRQLEAANQHKSEFLANMSHELRTPLNAIIGFSEVLIERMFGELNEKQEDYLKDIFTSGKHLLSLINDILDLSKIEAGRMELELSTFEVSGAITNAMTLIRERATQHGIALGLEVAPEIGERRADERKFKQILLNLLSNAVKFTPDGGRIEVRAALANSDVLEVSVSDTGIGIAPEEQAAVFEEFKQVGRHYTNKQEGTGLGLALTKRFVELHGGTLSVISTPGQGSIFTFIIPRLR